jgi:RNA recognition motif-containing protein
MSKKLFVGGLSWSTTDETLGAAFGAFGEVIEARVVTERGTGRSRGFGFVTFGSDEAAKAAAAEMNGKELDGRRIRVDAANESDRDRGERRPPRFNRDE